MRPPLIPLRHGTTAIAVDVLARRPELVLAIDGTAHRIVPREAGEPGAFALALDGIAQAGHVYATAEAIFVRHAGRTTIFTRPRRDGGGGGAAGGDVKADMPGVVVTVLCAAGDRVAAGAKLMTIESMKLQTTLSAPRDGVVARVHYGADAAFERGAVLVSLLPEGAGADGMRDPEDGRGDAA